MPHASKLAPKNGLAASLRWSLYLMICTAQAVPRTFTTRLVDLRRKECEKSAIYAFLCGSFQKNRLYVHGHPTYIAAARTPSAAARTPSEDAGTVKSNRHAFVIVDF